MAGNREICTTNHVEYLTIRKAMCAGVRTQEQLREKTNVCTACEGCRTEIPGILASVCGCKDVSLQAVVDAVQSGADTVEKVSRQTGAGTGENCGRCKALIENVTQFLRAVL